jgi:alpha-tubulin suppressor-like RCC1 family protein
MTGTGAVKCWGGNLDHEIGNDNVAAQTSMPTDTQVTSGALQITAGSAHTCVRLASGVSCWGSNAMGVLGSAATGSTATPVAVPGTAEAVDIAASGTNTCALDANGAVKCWGSGIGPFTATTWTPVGLAALFPGGVYHMCGITKTGGVLCWGSDLEGELGDGTNSGGTGPLGPMGVTAVSVGTGDEFTCSMSATNTVTCWGLNDDFQLGNTKSTPNTYSPTVVSGF